MRQFFIALTRNVISLSGTAVTTASAVLIIILFTVELAGFRGTPYVGILAFLILPAIFILGLILIPIGIRQERRRLRRAEEGAPQAQFPVIDLNRTRTRNVVLIFLGLTVVNVIILATATYKGVEVMDSTEFCGETCHSVMAPENTAYLGGPHARVNCVECHIGPGAPWFVKSKLSGAWQVVAVTFDLYPRPIPTPIENLRPARETCEQCHWPTIFVGDKLKVLTHYDEDEANTELKTVLLLRVGGVQGRRSHGIHWHVDPGVQIRYRSDPQRQTIYEVELTETDGTVKLYQPPDGTEREEGEEAEWRTMDCVDCHNRPSHVYKTPEQAIDEAIRLERIDRSLPYVRREGLRLLTAAPYSTHEEAAQQIASGLEAFYQDRYPELIGASSETIATAGQALGEVYAENVFPAMSVEWNTYPNHIGHENFPGCFRCHDDEHETEDGETISQDCSTCHSLLAWEEEDPEILAELQP